MKAAVLAMEKLRSTVLTRTMSATLTPIPAERAHPRPARVAKAIARRSFCTLATVSASGRPHVAGVLYVAAGDALHVSTRRSSRKARNIAANPDVFVCIPIRRLPVGPPSTVQFAATAEVLAVDHPDITGLVAAGRLGPITGHGELDLPDGCFLRITPGRTFHTYGLGLPLRELIRHPLEAAASFTLR